MNTKYLNPNFYVVSERLSFTIRGEVDLREPVDGDILQKAVNTAMKRFPYFSVRVVRKGGELLVEPNPLPHLVFHTAGAITLGSADVNYHLVVICYDQEKIFFHVSHCITDGAGRSPLTKAVLYYYLREKYPEDDIESEGIYLADSALYPVEEGLSVSLDEIMKAQPTYYRKPGPAFKLSEGHYITDNKQTEYRFRVDEKKFMAVNKMKDASPSVLVSALLTRVAWKLHPDTRKNIVTNLCMNMRPGLDNQHNYHPLFTCIPLICPEQMRTFDLEELCTSLRGMVILQSQEENVRYILKTMTEVFTFIQNTPGLEEKKRIFSKALFEENGTLSTTFVASYVGKNQMGCLSPYITEMFTTVDAIPEGGIIVEITSADGYFYFTFMQDFSTDVYYQEFTDQLEELGITVDHLGCGPILAAKMQLP